MHQIWALWGLNSMREIFMDRFTLSKVQHSVYYWRSFTWRCTKNQKKYQNRIHSISNWSIENDTRKTNTYCFIIFCWCFFFFQLKYIIYEWCVVVFLYDSHHNWSDCIEVHYYNDEKRFSEVHISLHNCTLKPLLSVQYSFNKCNFLRSCFFPRHQLCCVCLLLPLLQLINY